MRRRDVLTGAAKIGAFSIIAAPFVARAQDAKRIAYVGWGGSWGDFVKESWIKPFTAETGIAVESLAGPDLARIKAQVITNNVQWDVIDGFAYIAAKDGLCEPIDAKIIDPARFVRTPPSFGVPVYTFTGGIAYDPAKTKTPPNDFAQLWDVKTFPGRRGLRTRISEILEVALLADGVAPAELYPLDVERGFKSLDRIKPDVKHWFAETGQGTSLIQADEADYTYSYANRVKSAKDSGVSIDFSFGQCIIETNYFMVPKGSPRKEAAMRFLEFITRPEQQALMVQKIAYLPVTKGADRGLDETARRWLPDLNNPKNVFFNDQYWADHFIELDKRFKEWILT